MSKNYLKLLAVGMSFFASAGLFAESKHGTNPIYPSYTGRVMAGYQGWFRAAGDPSNRGWQHWGREAFNDDTCTVEAFPDVSEYEKLYDSEFLDENGKPIKVFSSTDAQTVDTHFRWMKEYGIDGAMVQRFFGATNPRYRNGSIEVLKLAKEASKKHDRALVVMYDLSGARKGQDMSKRLIEDWKFLVDELKITGGDKTNYMFHRGKPLVTIWGLGFIDRPYDLQSSNIEKFIKFLKEDPEYGNCSIMLGVPPTFRTLDGDTLSDTKLHELIKMCDIVSPWNPGRFRLDGTKESKESLKNLLKDRVTKDVKFCEELGVDYAPVIYPGFSWHNLLATRNQEAPFNWGPRLKGEFYWTMAHSMISNGSKMIYVAMFDEVDEGTAIFKIRDIPYESKKCKFITNDGMGSDFYLYLTGEIGKVLQGKRELSEEVPSRKSK